MKTTLIFRTLIQNSIVWLRVLTQVETDFSDDVFTLEVDSATIEPPSAFSGKVVTSMAPLKDSWKGHAYLIAYQRIRKSRRIGLWRPGVSGHKLRRNSKLLPDETPLVTIYVSLRWTCGYPDSYWKSARRMVTRIPLYQLVCGLQRYFRENQRPQCKAFEDAGSRCTSDSEMKHLNAIGNYLTKWLAHTAHIWRTGKPTVGIRSTWWSSYHMFLFTTTTHTELVFEISSRYERLPCGSHT